MTDFKNVTLQKAANFYFDGRVSSRTAILPTGEKITLGVMLPGDYFFDTTQHERVEIQAGVASVRLPGEDLWQELRAGDEFSVAKNTRFELNVVEVLDYCCTYS